MITWNCVTLVNRTELLRTTRVSGASLRFPYCQASKLLSNRMFFKGNHLNLAPWGPETISRPAGVAGLETARATASNDRNEAMTEVARWAKQTFASVRDEMSPTIGSDRATTTIIRCFAVCRRLTTGQDAGRHRQYHLRAGGGEPPRNVLARIPP